MPKRCYILGAGFSKPFGLPLARELTEAVIGRITSNSSDDPAGPLGWGLTQWNSFLRRLYPCCDFEGTWPEFEDLITILDEWEDYRHDDQGTPTPPGSNQPAHIRRVLLRNLVLLFCERTPANGDEKLEPVLQFVRRCAENKSPVISFNWDVLLEAAAEDEGIVCSYGKNDENAGLLLSKPHGSINLADIVNDPHMSPWSQRKTLLEYENNGGKRVVLCANDPRKARDEIVDPFGVGNNASQSGGIRTDQTPGSQAVQNWGEVLLVPPTAKVTLQPCAMSSVSVAKKRLGIRLAHLSTSC